MNLDEFYKDQYENELTRREQLASSLSLPIGVATIVGGAGFALAQSVQAPLDVLEIAVAALLALALAAGLGIAYFLFKVQIGYKYCYLPTPQSIEDYREALTVYYKARGKSDAEASSQADAEVSQYITRSYITAADANSRKNDAKSNYLANAYVCLVILVSVTFVASVIHTVGGALDGERPSRLTWTFEVK